MVWKGRVMKLGRGLVALAVSLGVGLSGCSHHAGTALPPVGAPGALTHARFTFTIPKTAAVASASRKPQYVAASTLSVKFTLVTVNGSAPPAGINPLTVNVTSTTNGCTTTAGVTTCVADFQIPVGSDQLKIQTFDAANAGGNLLSQQIKTFAPTAGIVNNFSITLDANPSTIAVTPPGGTAGSVGAGFTISGTSALTFTVTVSDTHGTALSNNTLAGSPVLSASSTNTGVAAITSVSQNPYSVTITPTGSTGSSTITFTAAPASGTDGLSNSTLSFTVSALPELIAVGSAGTDNSGNPIQGQINLYTLGAGALSTLAGTPTISLAGSDLPLMLGIDGNDKLYVREATNDQILEFPFNKATQTFGSATAVTNIGCPTNCQNAFLDATFSLDANGDMTVANPAGTANQLNVYPAGATSPTLGMTFSDPTGGQAFRGYDSAVLTSTAGVPFGYAVAMVSDDGTLTAGGTNFGPGRISVLSASGAITGGSNTTCTTGGACEETDLPAGPSGSYQDVTCGSGAGLCPFVLETAWDQADQELVGIDRETGVIWQYKFSGGAFGGFTTFANDVIGNDTSLGASIERAVSLDGHLAIAYGDSSGNTFIEMFDSNRNKVAGWNPKTLPVMSSAGSSCGEAVTNVPTGFAVFNMAFLPDDSLVVFGGYNINQIFVFNLSGTQIACNAPTLPGVSGSNITGNGMGQGAGTASVHRRPSFNRRALSRPVSPWWRRRNF